MQDERIGESGPSAYAGNLHLHLREWPAWLCPESSPKMEVCSPDREGNGREGPGPRRKGAKATNVRGV